MKRGRVRFLEFCLFVAMFTILARLFYIQIIKHDDYVAQASEEHVSVNVIEATRGKIYMMDGEEPVPVVLNEAVYTVVFDPTIVDQEKSREIFDKYAKDNLVAEWDEIFKDEKRRYFVVAKGVEYEKAKKIVEELSQAEVSGIYFEKTNKRVYPEGELAASVLGFVNSEGEGQYGVEGALNEELAGKDGSLKALRDVNGVVLSIGDENIETPAKNGEDIVLSIDRNVQAKVEEILKKYIDETAATKASAIVMNPRNGKIFAMANLPGYDPAKYAEVSDIGLFRNSAVDEPYEAASVCKTFTFAAAIDLGVMNAETTFYNSDSYTVDGLTIGNAYKGVIGTLTMQQAFNYSLNTGSSTALQLISGGSEINEFGRKRLYDYLQKFKLGKETGVELYESTGFVPSPNEYDYTMNFTYANMTFGQGMNLTMVQIASAVAAIINDGYYNTPSIVAGQMMNGKFIVNEGKAKDQVVSSSTSAQMRDMFYGTRKSRRNRGIDRPGYFIGGKTGTGQVVLDDGSYSEATAEGETIGGYVGFGGKEGELPEYLVMIKLWGEGQHIGGEQVEPVFDDISNYLIDYLKIQPKL